MSIRYHPSIRLEHVIALSDEMAALARSGVPLERGLANFGRDVPGELGRLSLRLAERLERGESLSAGERQLVALVRAHLADPDLLVLDEATSAVDPALEMRIAAALERLTSGRTSVTIAHRMTTAEKADEVVVVDAGRVVQRGPHVALLEEGGVYGRLYASWVAQQSLG